MGTNNFKLVANNKKAYHDYFIDDKYETGIELYGTEVKSIRMGKCSIKEAFVRIENGQVYIYGMHISPYEKGNIFNKDPLRQRKLLMHRREIDKLLSKMTISLRKMRNGRWREALRRRTCKKPEKIQVPEENFLVSLKVTENFSSGLNRRRLYKRFDIKPKQC